MATWTRGTPAWAFLSLLVSLGACEATESGTGLTQLEPGTLVTDAVTVGPQGGTLSADGIEITVPPGALEQDVEARLVFRTQREADDTEDFDYLQPGSVALELDPPNARFKGGAVVQFSGEHAPDLSDLSSEAHAVAAVMAREDATHDWKALPTALDPQPAATLEGPAELVLAVPKFKGSESKREAAEEPKPGEAPERWRGMVSHGPTGAERPGATPENVQWLYEWHRNAAPIYRGLCSMWSCMYTFLSEEDIQEIVDSVKRLEAPRDRLRRAADLVHVKLLVSKDKRVCRHYAISLHTVLRALGFRSAIRCGRAGWGITGHAWVEVEHEGERYLLDAQGQTYVHIASDAFLREQERKGNVIAAATINPNATATWVLDRSFCPFGVYAFESNDCGPSTLIDAIVLSEPNLIRYRWEERDYRTHPRGTLPLALWGHLQYVSCGTFCDPTTKEMIRDCWGGSERVRVCQQRFKLKP